MPTRDVMAEMIRKKELLEQKSALSDPLWDFEIQATGRKIGELIDVVATLMRHGYTVEAQGIAHAAAALALGLEQAICERNQGNPGSSPTSYTEPMD